VGRDSEHGGRRLESNGLVKAGFELPKFPVHNDDRGAIIHPDNTAKPVIEADDIACTEPEWMLVRHPDNGEKLGLIRVFERTIIAFHGECSLCGGGVAAVAFAGVIVGGLVAKDAARVLPNLAVLIPMESDLRQHGCNLAGLFLRELNPNPLADNLRQPEKQGRFPLQEV
jgi:hypothetical protein